MTNRDALAYAVATIMRHGLNRDIVELVDPSKMSLLEEQEAAIERLNSLASAPDIDVKGYG